MAIFDGQCGHDLTTVDFPPTVARQLRPSIHAGRDAGKEREMPHDPRITVGTQFQMRGKDKAIWTVKDELTTTNLKGEIVEVRYLCSKSYLGQELTCSVYATTIFMGGIIECQ